MLLMMVLLILLTLGHGNGSGVPIKRSVMLSLAATATHADPRFPILHFEGPPEEFDVPEQLRGVGHRLRVVELDEAKVLLALRLPIHGDSDGFYGTGLKKEQYNIHDS